MAQILSLLLLLATVAVTYGSIAPQPVYTMFRSQDELGGYHFGYSGGPSSRAEQRDHNGVVRGAYNYVDADGTVQKYQYISDEGGYRLLSGTNIPVAPVHQYVLPVAPVVASLVPVVPATLALQAPKSVEETADVKRARAEFMIAYNKIAAAAAAAPDTP